MHEPEPPDEDIHPGDGDPPGATGPADLATTAHLVAGHMWVEEALFEVTGRWSADGAAPVASFFAAQSSFHAWRAEEWRRRLPRSVPAPVGAPGREWDDAVALAAGLGPGTGSEAARLGAWVGALVPSLVSRYRAHGPVTADAADGGLRRWLRIAADDVVRGWVEGTALLDAAVRGDHAALESALDAERGCRRLLSG
jgi:hypothetical protein